MKSLGSGSIGAKEGIGIAVCTVFLELQFDIKEVEKIAESVGTSGFLDFHDAEMGRVIIENSDICDRFTKYLTDNPHINYIWLLSNPNPDPKRGFGGHIETTLGGYVKTTKWWRDNLKEIEKMRRKVKIVQKVMEQ